MEYFVLGVSHKTAPVAVRERLMVSGQQLPIALAGMRRQFGVEESLLLSTCNRMEIYLVGTDLRETAAHVQAGFCLEERHFYAKKEREAVTHLFRVASSLDSMMVGENQISHQVKQAYQAAMEAGTIGKHLHRIVPRALSAAKRVRTETGISEYPVSVSYAAVVLAKKIFGELAFRKVLLLGAGEMAELACRHFSERGAVLAVCNRTEARARALMEKFSAQSLPFERLREELHHYDVIVTSVSAPDPLLSKADFERVMRLRRNRALFVIDIAVPRNVAPDSGELDNLFLFNIDSLEGIVEENKQGRSREAEAAERIIQTEVERVFEDLRADGVGPMIRAFQGRMEELRRQELGVFLARHPEMSPEERAKMESFSRSMMGRILHEPVMKLREGITQWDEEQYVVALKNLFEKRRD